MRKTTYPFLLAVIVAVFGALVSAGLSVSAQNSNSSTTMTNSNTNTSRPRRPQRPRPRPSPSPEVTDTMADTTVATPPRTGRCDPNQHEPADLSGTYTGKVKHGDAPERDATLTISGNSITIASGSDSHSGRITAVTTCGYTAVTIMQGDGGTSEPGKTSPPNKVISLRAKKVGDSLTLMSVPGEPEKVMFTSGGDARRPRRQRPRRPAPPPPASPTTPPQQ